MTVEQFLAAYLIEYFEEDETVKVATEEPQERYDNLILFEQTGSSESNLITRATIAVQSFGQTREKAMLLNERVKEAMLSCVERQEIASVELITDYNYTDQQTKRNRYQAVFEVVYYK